MAGSYLQNHLFQIPHPHDTAMVSQESWNEALGMRDNSII